MVHLLDFATEGHEQFLMFICVENLSSGSANSSFWPMFNSILFQEYHRITCQYRKNFMNSCFTKRLFSYLSVYPNEGPSFG